MGEISGIYASKYDAKREKSCHDVRKTKPAQVMISPADRVLSLQRTIGNQAVQRLIRSGGLQAKLTVSQPGDIYEREADSVAERVMKMQSTRIRRSCRRCEDEMLQRQPLEMGGEPVLSASYPCPSLPPAGAGEKEEKLQRKALNDAEACPGTLSITDTLKSGGQPLPGPVRSFFEPRFGYDFSHVRIHTGEKASAVARAINARAFTLGRDVAFGPGEYAPGTTEGNRLLAHELTHVVQQNAPGKANTILQRAWVTGAPSAGINTIVCDGSGGIIVQAGATGNAQQTRCLRDCIIRHEESHRADALAANATVCNGQSANRIVTVNTAAERKDTEVRASNAEISCLRARPDTNDCRAIISARITQMEQYRDSF